MPPQRIRILHVIPHLGPGGTERVVLTLLRKLSTHARYDLRLCVLGTVDAFPERIPRECRPVFLKFDGSLRDLRGMRRCRRELRDLINVFDPHIIHSHLWPACRMASAAARRHAAAHLFHAHDTRPWLADRDLRSRFMRLATYRAWARCRPLTVAVSRAVANYTCQHLGIPEETVRVIYNFVDTQRFAPPKHAVTEQRDTLRLGVVALLKPEKGHVYLLNAVQQLHREGLPIEVRLAGTGKLESALREQCRDMGIQEQVRFMGLLSDIPAFLSELDILVLPSAFGEGLPMTVLEGMAMGVPVIATDVAGTGEVVANGKTGLLVPPCRPTALANAIRRLATQPRERDAMSIAARQIVIRRFSLEHACEELTAAYDEALDLRQQHSRRAGS